MLDEDRDTTDPIMVADWLMSYTAALGEVQNCLKISKNTREEVLWKDCQHPWRRSSLWLLIRVNLQLLFARKGNKEKALAGLYKAFMAQLLSRLLILTKENWSGLGSEPVYLTYAKLTRRIWKVEALGQLTLLDAK